MCNIYVILNNINIYWLLVVISEVLKLEHYNKYFYASAHS